MFINLKNSFLSFYLVLVSFPIMSSNIIVPNEEILEKPFPLPYERVGLSESDLRNFINNTINNDKQPVVIFGANWCPDCRIFSGTMDIPKIHSYINKHFEILYIDVKRYEINMELMEEYGIPSAEGIPRVLVFDKNKNLINNSNTTEWRTARDRTSQEIFDFFQSMSKS